MESSCSRYSITVKSTEYPLKVLKWLSFGGKFTDATWPTKVLNREPVPLGENRNV